MKNICKALLLFSLITITNISYGQSKAVLIDSMLHRTNRLGLFNGNVLVADKGKIIYQAALGYADASKQVKLTEQYRFHIGSIAKEFNAVAIIMLKEEGKLNLDDKVAKYFPQLPAWANQISIKNLLQYTSGLPDVKWQTVKSDADNWADLQALDKLNFEPGTNYAYNNNNTFLQRRIIEKVSGISFKEFVEQRMLKPLKMTTGIIDPDDSALLMAKAYNNKLKQDALIYPITGWTALTLTDFYKWEQGLENFKLISPAATLEILTPFGPNKQCGLGGGNMEGGKIINHQHDGTSLNYQALLTGHTKPGITIILMTNNKQNNLYDLNRVIEAILDGKPFQQPKKSILANYQPQLDSLSGDQLLSLYNDLKAKHAAEYGFENESTLNEIGYYLLNKKRVDDAITIFDYNTKLFPKSGNVYDSLGEAYYGKGDKPKALLNYKRSLELDPSNTTAKAVIAELEKK
ncbi:serine hydrolase [Mucilaginibacter sp.]|jgi:CubicO group peptidase (beta-lactamase class C family)|uniref:serine hydrolase n=1 Tax=Mucilaginibacter sp. TaxID=1882438 RepID=UPI003561EED3